MTTPNHITQSALISLWLFPNNYFIMAVAMILGSFADLVRLFQKDINDWRFYEKLHSLTWWNLIIPFHNLHILEDYVVHDHVKGGWNKLGIPLEIITWGIMMFVLIGHLK